MKSKLFLLIVSFFFFSEVGNAQIRYGARLSGSLTNITLLHAQSQSRMGMQIAAIGLVPVSNNDIFFIEPEINISFQGEYDNPINRDKNIRKKQKIFSTFINIPVNAKVYFSDAESEFFAIGGPYLGIRIGGNVEKMDYPTETDDYEYTGFDFGGTLGIGYSLNRQIEFSLRYSYGLLDQVKNDRKNYNNSTSILNFGISYIFD